MEDLCYNGSDEFAQWYQHFPRFFSDSSLKSLNLNRCCKAKVPSKKMRTFAFVYTLRFRGMDDEVLHQNSRQCIFCLFAAFCSCPFLPSICKCLHLYFNFNPPQSNYPPCIPPQPEGSKDLFSRFLYFFVWNIFFDPPCVTRKVQNPEGGSPKGGGVVLSSKSAVKPEFEGGWEGKIFFNKLCILSPPTSGSLRFFAFFSTPWGPESRPSSASHNRSPQCPRSAVSRCAASQFDGHSSHA